MHSNSRWPQFPRRDSVFTWVINVGRRSRLSLPRATVGLGVVTRIIRASAARTTAADGQTPRLQGISRVGCPSRGGTASLGWDSNQRAYRSASGAADNP
jgi:hypothetical protein